MAQAWNEYFDCYLEGKPPPLLREKFVDGEEDPAKPPARSRRKSE